MTVSVFAASLSYAAPVPNNTPSTSAISPGPYLGFQFGYVDTDFADELSMYTPGKQSTTPDGSYFLFRPEIGYNFTPSLGVELGGLHIHDSAESHRASSSDPVQKASITLTDVDLLALIHLPLTEDRSWVSTPKLGVAFINADLHYQYTDGNGAEPPWGAPASGDSKKRLFVPVAGIEFEHSYNKHWVMTFAYQYYYGKYAKFDDPYFTRMSTLDFFSVGTIYKF
jgi:hypothetical protein